MDSGVSRRLRLLAVVLVAGALAPVASAYSSFFLSISSAYIYSYSNNLDVRVSASYRDYDCTPSYSCDRSVIVEVVLHRGYSTYSPIVARRVAETGQYGSSVSASFRLPNCRYIRKYSSQPYVVEVNAVAPDGTEKSTSRLVSLRSCAP